MKALMLLLQLVLLAAALFTAGIAAPALPFIRGFVVGAVGVPLSNAELKLVFTTFFSFHLLLYLVSSYFNRKLLFSSLKRTVDEIHFVIVGTILSACHLFLFTDISFDVNFFAYACISNGGSYLLALLIASYARRSDRDVRGLWLGENPFIATVKAFVFSRWALLTGLSMLALGLLAFHYKHNGDFRNSVNYLRVSLNVGSDASWELVDPHPGQRFDQPIDVRFEPGNVVNVYVLERPGRLYRVSTKPLWRKDLLLDIGEEVGETKVENGALSFALHPEFGTEESPNRHLVYVYYTHARPGMQRNRLSRFDLSSVDSSERSMSEVNLIEQGRDTSGFHNGGSVLFGPDGFLYLSIGDLGRANSQSIDGSLAGGIIRIDVDKRGGSVSRPIRKQPHDGKTANYYIPSDNPFYGVNEVLEEFWALGFRNPFRMAIDRETGEVWLGDVGNELYEEVNKVAKGSNGQAPYREGPVFTGQEKPKTIWGTELGPVHYYRQTGLMRAVIGGVIYRGNKYPELYGHYIFADNQAGLVWAYEPAKPRYYPRFLARTDQLGANGITSLNETPDGDIYLTVLGTRSGRSGRILSLEKTSFRRSAVQVSGETTYAGVSEQYDMLCSRCHGIDGKGHTSTPLEGKATNFTVAAWQERTSDQQIKSVITNGGAEIGLSRDMPSWRGVFSEAELDLMVKKIRSFGKPE